MKASAAKKPAAKKSAARAPAQKAVKKVQYAQSERSATRVQGRLWLSRGDQTIAGSGRIALLLGIAERGSISQAAKSMGMSYKSAWDAVDAMNNAAEAPLVVRVVGGPGGGGAALTERGRRLVEAFRLFEREHQRFLDRLSLVADDIGPYMDLLGRDAMRTSARNQFFGTISAVHRGAVNDVVELALAGGQRIVATITRDSTDSLGLAEGVEAFALVKASWVILMAPDENIRTSARNTFTGVVERIEKGAVNSEVTLTLAGGTKLVAIVTNASADSLPLRAGERATALVKASHVIIGVPA
jgi:molybdate transport system regulatory protein